MSLTIRRWYLLYFLMFMVACLLLNFSADLFLDIVQGDMNSPESWRHELEEFGFFVLANLLALPFLVMLAVHFAERMVRPVRAITETAQSISRGDIERRVETKRADDELGRLADELNRAFDRYSAVLKQQQRFNSNAAHQLRTPLASLRSTGEVALQQPRTEQQYRDAIADMLEETIQLTRLVEQMLELSRLERGEQNVPMDPVDLSTVVNKVIEDYAPLCEEKSIELVAELQKTLPCHGNDILLEQLVANLVDNAIYFTPCNGRIDVSGRLNGNGRIVLTVADSGPGLSEPERQTIFERFAQGSTPHPDGHGLGLAIAQEIVRLHGGDVRAEESPSGGAAFVTRLPAR